MPHYEYKPFKVEKTHFSNILRMQKFEITVVTGNCECAGTDANVFIKLLGKDGESGEQKLSKRNRQVEPYKIVNDKVKYETYLTRMIVELFLEFYPYQTDRT